MVIVCPKCKIKLKIDEGKLSSDGSRFKCPICKTVFLVKKPLAVPKKAIDNNKILVAHSNPVMMDEIIALLSQKGYQTITASDGIDAMTKAMRELPFLTIIEVALPKIYGFEVCKRLKLRSETKEIRVILVASVYDKKRYRREPESLYGADDYLEDHHISEFLLEKINALRGVKPEEKKEEIEKPKEEVIQREEEVFEQKIEPRITTQQVISEMPLLDERIERAKRLARTVIADIYLYNTVKVEESIRNNRFYTDFATEINEGLKLYENRISQEVRAMGDFFKEAVESFIENKKKNI
ncbi:MAG: zinc-ribbon domain-containing protein [Nitrospirota bacterium]|nr:zinc-ribbon domain-containing protein [Nitrospirota bacterium]MDH5768894.1 zinc-ribbon domain-containing protein [Nitrospirota bacterium]